MSNYAGLPACTRRSADTLGDDTAVIEFFRLVYPLNYCYGWKNLFSLTENLTQLLSEEGCVLSSTCSYDPNFESQPHPCCRLCIFFEIRGPGSRLKIEFERTQPTSEHGVDGGDSEPLHPLEGVLLKRIIGPNTKLSGPRFLFTDKGDEAERFLAQTAELDIRGWASKIRTAVSRCREAGQSCAPRPHALPKRLIQVQNEDLGEEDVRLYQSKEGELGNYVALSYVWGGPQKATTTHSNLAQHLAAISVKSLRKSIRDAIIFVRALGIKYVWVDALCIVQDDDKIDEINNMGRIYRNAWVVIAAEASHGAEQGFLQEWPVRRSPAFDINLPNGRSGTVMIGAGGLDFLEIRGRPEPLRSRCWALQESILSPRLVTFHSESISYECTTTSHGDMFAFDKTQSFEGRDRRIDQHFACWHPTGAVIARSHRPTLPSILRYPLIGKGLTAAAQSHGGTGANALPYLILAWRDIIWEYAGRQLTVWQDRLPALAGVAAQFAASIGPENYLAGLWKPYIISQLTWLPAPLMMAAPGQLPIDKDVRDPEAVRAEGFLFSSMYLPSATDRDERTTLNPVKADGFATGTYLPSSPAATLVRNRKYGRSAALQSPTWSWCTHQRSGRWSDGFRERAVMISSTQTLVSDKAPFGAVLHATITVQAQFLSPSSMKVTFNWANTYLYMDYSGNVLAECGIEPSLYMLLGTTMPCDVPGESTGTVGLVLRACEESSQRCLFGKSVKIPHYQRIGIIKVSRWESDIWYGPEAQRAIVTLI